MSSEPAALDSTYPPFPEGYKTLLVVRQKRKKIAIDSVREHDTVILGIDILMKPGEQAGYHESRGKRIYPLWHAGQSGINAHPSDVSAEKYIGAVAFSKKENAFRIYYSPSITCQGIALLFPLGTEFKWNNILSREKKFSTLTFNSNPQRAPTHMVLVARGPGVCEVRCSKNGRAYDCDVKEITE